MYTDRLLLIFILGAYFISPAIVQLWNDDGSFWYLPFLFWASLIILSYWIGKSRDFDDR